MAICNCPVAATGLDCQRRQGNAVYEWVGMSELGALRAYLEQHDAENILLLSDLRRRGLPRDAWSDDLTLSGFSRDERLVAVQGFYRFGRWMPHFAPDADADCVAPLIDEMTRRRALGKRFNWVMGARRVIDPILTQLGPRAQIGYDELDHLLYVTRRGLVPVENAAVRRATMADQEAVCALRIAFEAEYFDVSPQRISREWCSFTAGRYIRDGVYLAEVDGRAVSMVAAEARLANLAQVGAVYTVAAYRNRGLARGVVSALCGELLDEVSRVTLTVRHDNPPAQHIYRQLGFAYWFDYRMTRLD